MGRYLVLLWLGLTLFTNVPLKGQDSCYVSSNRRAIKKVEKAKKAIRDGNGNAAIEYFHEAIEIDDEYIEPYWRIGKIYYHRKDVKNTETYFNKVIELCPDYDVYVYYYLARIAYGRDDYDKTIALLEIFLEDPDKIKRDEDYDNALFLFDQAVFYRQVYSNKVPFNPQRVEGISTDDDEYLAIISADNDIALFTRKTSVEKGLATFDFGPSYEEKFMISERLNGTFDRGMPMPPPFNSFGNEGAATITIDNNEIFYTVCQDTVINDRIYNNCDIYHAKRRYGVWQEISLLDTNDISMAHTWESQPSITSDGKTLYFASDREGGFGGVDIYSVSRDEKGLWGKPINLGKRVNTAGNEKSPFIHSDSQTLYFSSGPRVDYKNNFYEGHKGLGGYDIFYLRLNEQWQKPKNIGFPINTADDELGFFVSTDGKYGFFASNKFEKSGGWNLYQFDLHKEAQPQKVLLIKGELLDKDDVPVDHASVELKNIETNKVTFVNVDSTTGRYAAATLFKNDFVLTVKKKDHAYQSRYISKDSAVFEAPAEIDFTMEKIEVGQSYQLHDIYFNTNSAELNKNSLFILDGFIEFLEEHPMIDVVIHGHTDAIGSEVTNQVLSEKRAETVYNYLISNGISPARLSYRGFGEDHPVADNTTKEGRAKNRRTEFVITRK